MSENKFKRVVWEPGNIYTRTYPVIRTIVFMWYSKAKPAGMIKRHCIEDRAYCFGRETENGPILLKVLTNKGFYDI